MPTSSPCALFLLSRVARMAQRRASFSRLAPPSSGCSRDTWARMGLLGRVQMCSSLYRTDAHIYLLDAIRLEALLRHQREGGVVLQEEEEVLLPAHLQRGE